MKLSISNIAWPHDAEIRILKMVAEAGFSAIEVAPSRIWSDFRLTSKRERKEYLHIINEYGLEICSMHSLFWNNRESFLFGSYDEQSSLQRYFRDLINLACDLNIPHMVFGSPGIRYRGEVDIHKAYEIAAKILHPVAEYANSFGTRILIEPLSSQETDFITNHIEGINLVKAVDSRGLGLHLDAKAICSEFFPIETIITDSKDIIEHFHVNEEGLGSFFTPKLPHQLISEHLNGIGYKGYVSIEMRELDDYEEEVRRALCYVREVYG